MGITCGDTTMLFFMSNRFCKWQELLVDYFALLQEYRLIVFDLC